MLYQTPNRLFKLAMIILAGPKKGGIEKGGIEMLLPFYLE